MILKIITAQAIIVCALLTGCNQKNEKERLDASHTVPNVVTEDIQIGIENYIEDQVSLGNGYFHLPYKNGELRLKLVRVHTEYLANLGPRRHFACVDLADISGDVYDVDFFLAGDPGSMSVTETIVHKINGQPFYAWEQKKDKTWHRIPVKNATENHFGVIRDRDEFEILYRVILPEIANNARMWLPLPETDAFQTVKIMSIDAPSTRSTLRELQYGNRVLFLELSPKDSKMGVDIRFHVERHEKSAYYEKTTNLENYLRAELLVPNSETFSDIAEQAVKGKKTDLVRARALYDHVIDRMRYIKFGTGWGKGDAVYACDARTGNCTDFHSYFIALARAVNIPARFAIGLSIPSNRNEGGVDGYHCWAEFYAEDKWWPVDISEGDKYTNLATYYFGHHPANRFELSRGRDLVVKPGPASGPINFLAHPVLEMDGKPVAIKAHFSFIRLNNTD